MASHALKSMVLIALLAYAPGIYLRFLRRGQWRKGEWKLAAARVDPVGAQRRPRVLVVDVDFPDPTQNAGARAICHFVELLQELGAKLTFWSVSQSPSPNGRDYLAALGVEVASRQPNCDLSRWLMTNFGAKPFDAVVLSRPSVAASYGGDARSFGSGRCLYYGHDIHFRRMEAMRQFDTSCGAAFATKCMKKIEQSIWRQQDTVLYPSSEEVAYVNDYRAARGMPPNAELLPLWSVPDKRGDVTSAAGRQGVLFVGSHAHAPNTDGLDWFFTRVLPRVRAKGLCDTVYIVGAGMDLYRPPVADQSVNILGWIDDVALEALYARVRMVIVPLRYGGGVKGKVLEAMAHGVPCVATTAAAQGFLAAQALDPSDDEDRFADDLMALAENDDLWLRRSASGLAYLHQTHARATIRQRVAELVLGH